VDEDGTEDAIHGCLVLQGSRGPGSYADLPGTVIRLPDLLSLGVVSVAKAGEQTLTAIDTDHLEALRGGTGRSERLSLPAHRKSMISLLLSGRIPGAGLAGQHHAALD